MAFQIQRTTAENPHFQELIKQLDAGLKINDGEQYDFFSQFNHVDQIKHVIVVFENDHAVGCGAIKQYSEDTMEIKRMFVHPQSRGKNLGTQILIALENWAIELEANKCILETGLKQIAARVMYQKNGYRVIPNYDQYEGVAESVCMEKLLS